MVLNYISVLETAHNLQQFELMSKLFLLDMDKIDVLEAFAKYFKENYIS